MNKFTARGISKDTGKFVYGYTFHNKEENKWCIFNQSLIKDGDTRIINGGIEQKYKIDIVEITQEPDKFIGTRYNLYENDTFKICHKDLYTGNPITEKECEENRKIDFKEMVSNIYPKGTKTRFENWDYIKDGIYTVGFLDGQGLFDIYIERKDGEAIDHNILLSELEKADFDIEIIGNTHNINNKNKG